jgi:hypothetical protein
MNGYTPDMLLNMLYQTHVHSTEHQPFCYHTFPKLNIDENKLQDAELLHKCINEAYVEYKTTEPGKLKGSVDVNPVKWMQFFLESVLLSNKNNADIQAPNGCCNTKNCGIKKFYEILYEHLSKL